MSYFDNAYAITMSHEGGYVNDPDDAGGETYKGISRVYNPSWIGWQMIDSYKTFDDFPKCLELDDALQDAVKQCYKERYFDPFRGDQMPENIACEMFDTAVNMGVGRAVKFLQISLNVLNRNGSLYQDQVEDGDYGKTTDKCYRAFMEKDGDSWLLVKMLNVLQGMHYINYMKKSPTQEKYARGWFKRVSIDKK